MTALYASWREVAPADWVWPHFSPREIACRGDGSLLVVPAFLNLLEKLRDKLGRPLTVNCAYRSALHNARVGGAPMSEHKFGRAADIACAKDQRTDLLLAARAVGFTGFGFYASFLHLDIGLTRTWGTAWN